MKLLTIGMLVSAIGLINAHDGEADLKTNYTKSYHQDMCHYLDEQLAKLQESISDELALNALVLEQRLRMNNEKTNVRHMVSNKSQMQQMDDANYETLLQLDLQRLKFKLRAIAQLQTIILNPEILIKEYQIIISELPKEITDDAIKNFYEIAQEKKAKIILDEIENKYSVSDDEIKEQIKKELMKRIDFFIQLKKACSHTAA